MRLHTTHHESCGCCEAERDALKAQVERLREALVRKNMALRVLCEESRSYIEWSKQMPFERAIDEALAETTDMAALAERAPEVPR